MNRDEMIAALGRLQRKDRLMADIAARYPETWNLPVGEMPTEQLEEIVSVHMICELDLPDDNVRFSEEQIELWASAKRVGASQSVR
jgi:hypothetical protein